MESSVFDSIQAFMIQKWNPMVWLFKAAIASIRVDKRPVIRQGRVLQTFACVAQLRECLAMLTQLKINSRMNPMHAFSPLN